MIARLFVLVFVAAAMPQEARRWAEALASYQKLAGSKDPYERARAVRELGIATTEKYDKQCLKLVRGVMDQEIAREGPGGKFEEKVSGLVLEECIDTLRRITVPEVVAEMAKAARATREHPRARAHLLWALGRRGGAEDIIDLVDDKSPIVQIAAIDALIEKAEAAWRETRLRVTREDDRTWEFVQVLLRVIRDDTRAWEARLGALLGIEIVGDERCVEGLIEGLGTCRASEGRLRDLYFRLLTKHVGMEIRSDDPNAWKAAWALKKQGKDPAKPQGTTIVEETEFYGLKTRSSRIVFILDKSGSMNAAGSDVPRPATPPPPPPTATGPKEPPQEAVARDEAIKLKKKYESMKSETRMQAAKKEFITSIFLLDARVHFNVIWFEANPTPWSEQLVPATWHNKLDAMRSADKMTAGGGTNIWDGLEFTYRMIAQPPKGEVVAHDKRANYATALNGVDTVFLMTDGDPTAGRIQKPPEILAELRKVNRLRKAIINTICVGDKDPANPAMSVDPAFLKRIADENGGAFMHLKK